MGSAMSAIKKPSHVVQTVFVRQRAGIGGCILQQWECQECREEVQMRHAPKFCPECGSRIVDVLTDDDDLIEDDADERAKLRGELAKATEGDAMHGLPIVETPPAVADEWGKLYDDPEVKKFIEFGGWIPHHSE